jgi:hypothetical protein
MEPIRIGYNKVLGVVVLLVAAGNLAAYFALGGHLVQIGLSVAAAAVGVLYLMRPFLVVTDTSIQARSLFGYSVKRFGHDGLPSLEVDGTAIVLGKGERRQRLRLPRVLVSRADLARLGAAADAARVTASPS